HTIEGLYRIRLSSLEATEVDDRLIELAASSDKFCPHFHLPLQSGDDYVLKMMNRHYTAREYLGVVDKIKSKMSLPSFSTDIIVGFPGEGAEHFNNTLKVCREVGFSRVHIFPFSPRRGTPASQMTGMCDPQEVKERKGELETLAQGLALEYKKNFLGKEIEVLVEESPFPGTYSGYSERYIKAYFPGSDSLMGKMVEVKVEEVFPGYVRASRR
ncbi:MAG: radical SAM protein, partial [Candidatus Brocadiales bacterium]